MQNDVMKHFLLCAAEAVVRYAEAQPLFVERLRTRRESNHKYNTNNK